MYSGLNHILTHFSSFFFIAKSCLHKEGTICNHKSYLLTTEDKVNEGDLWEMEVDLRSEEKEKRTLHWFVRGKQQKGFIKGVPDRVEFAV